MNLIQSFFSLFLSDKYKLMYASYCILSSIYAKNSGFEITLFCDYDFKQLMDKSQHKCIEEVDEFKNIDIYNDINRRIFAWPKFIVLDKVNRDTIHIDCDVFLKTKNCQSLFNGYNDYKVICQHKEKLCFTEVNESYINSFESVKHLKFPDFVVKEVPQVMPNNGILMINDQKLWEEYKDLYWSMIELSKQYGINEVLYSCPDLIFEQYFLDQICKKNNIDIKYVFPQENFDEIFKSADDIGYQHMCSDKMQDLPICLSLIKKKDKLAWESLKYYFGNKFPEYFE